MHDTMKPQESQKLQHLRNQHKPSLSLNAQSCVHYTCISTQHARTHIVLVLDVCSNFKSRKIYEKTHQT